MTNKNLKTDSYKGVRDFYPEDMAIQRYIFDVWSKTSESFGFEQYDASVLEPTELYESKTSSEIVSEQTYTFTDRGDRSVTLRPEMTPTVARMIAGKRRELFFPVRWYSIPNLFRYERTQRGRLREHWQLNCDIFGSNDYTTDVEIIALAHQIFVNFGAESNMFEIRVNNRSTMKAAYNAMGITEEDKIVAITRLNDRKNKIKPEKYFESLTKIVGDRTLAVNTKNMIESPDSGENAVVEGLKELGITNVKLDRSLARGFDYYTGTIFEIFDVSDENNRSMLGGGRYDNLTELFGGDPISGIGFGMGDVTMRDFLDTHDLLTANITAPELMIIPTVTEYNLKAQKIAKIFRDAGVSVSVDMSEKKIGKKLSNAGDSFVSFALVLGEDEIKSEKYEIKNLTSGEKDSGEIEHLINKILS